MDWSGFMRLVYGPLEGWMYPLLTAVDIAILGSHLVLPLHILVVTRLHNAYKLSKGVGRISVWALVVFVLCGGLVHLTEVLSDSWNAEGLFLMVKSLCAVVSWTIVILFIIMETWRQPSDSQA